MTAETLSGYLHVLRTRKRPRTSNPFERLIIMGLEDALHETRGRPIPEYPPTYWFHVPGRTVRLARRPDDERTWRDDRLFMFRFKGRPKLLDREMEGWRITVRGTCEPWDNGLGGYMRGYRVIGVNPPAEGDSCPCKSVESPSW